MNTNQTGDQPLVYHQDKDLTPHETRKLIRLAKAIKNRRIDKGLIEIGCGKSNELYIVGLDKAA